MKTSEEMAQSVMTRARARRSAQKRNLITAAVSLVCVCGIGVGAWIMGRTPAQPVNPQHLQSTNAMQLSPTEELPTQPTEPSVPNQVTNIELRPVRISLLSSLSSGGDTVTLENGVRIPGQQQIRVVDMRGMTTEEKQAVADAERKYATDFKKKYKEALLDTSWCTTGSETAIITAISAGYLHIPIEDADLVDSVRVSVIGDGMMYHIEGLKEETGETIPGEYVAKGYSLVNESMLCGGVNMIWTLSGEKMWELSKDPTIPLSSISSTITATINMKDGSKRSVIVDISVDDDGMVYFTSRGETAT